MDMLRSEEARTAILSYYQDSDEPDAIKIAIEDACRTPGGDSELQTKQRWNENHFNSSSYRQRETDRQIDRLQ